MERKIGETFEYKDRKLKTIEKEGIDDCNGCVLFKEDCKMVHDFAGECEGKKRSDNKGVVFVNADEFDEQPEEQAEQLQAEKQSQKLNLCELLKDCPRGTKLYSTVLGYVIFQGILAGAVYPIIVTCENGVTEDFTADGKMFIDYDGECTLFPSKEQRSWTDFIAPWYKKERFDPKTLKSFDKIIFKGHGMWFCGLFSHIHNSYACVGETYYKCVIPYNDDTKHLVGTRDEAPDFYRYWED